MIAALVLLGVALSALLAHRRQRGPFAVRCVGCGATFAGTEQGALAALGRHWILCPRSR